MAPMADARPLVIWLVLAAALVLAVEAGYRLRARAGPPASGETEGSGYVVSAALGLLGLLIAFTFAFAAERYDSRRRLVIEEANAISTTWLRQQLFDEPARARLADAMSEYVQVRLQLPGAGMAAARLDAVDARTAALQSRIWAETATALKAPAAAPLTVAVLQTTNDMFDLAASRRAELDARVPKVILWTLTGYAAAVALLMGHGLAESGQRRLIGSSGLFLLAALAIALIVDLDAPRLGAVRVSEAPMERVAAMMAAAPKP
jgi:hypothetical protein